MYLIILSLGVGMVIGYLRPLSPEKARLANAATTVGLFILLMSMGAQLGGNEDVLAGLGRLGLQAVILAAFSVLGSVFMVCLARGYIYKGLDEKLGRRQGGISQ